MDKTYNYTLATETKATAKALRGADFIQEKYGLSTGFNLRDFQTPTYKSHGTSKVRAKDRSAEINRKSTTRVGHRNADGTITWEFEGNDAQVDKYLSERN